MQEKIFTISGSGELDNGWGISVFHALGDTHAYSSSVYSFDMGAIGTLSLDSGSGGHGAAAIDNICQQLMKKLTMVWQLVHLI